VARSDAGTSVRAVTQVLVVEDDPAVGEVVRRYLEHDGMDVRVCSTGSSALSAARTSPPCLVVLDLGLPDLDGLEVFSELRRQAAEHLPVILLTARGEEEDRLLGLGAGADDYVTKPFSPRELVLRVHSVLRRPAALPTTDAPPADGVLVDGDLHVDLAAHSVRLGDGPRSLSAREYDLLVFLLRNPRQAFSRKELLHRVWGWEHADLSTVTVHVRRLREKVEADPGRPTRVVTVFGTGYRYDPGAPT